MNVYSDTVEICNFSIRGVHMAKLNKRIHELLDIAFRIIAAQEHKTIEAVEQECGRQIGYTSHTIDGWRRGYIAKPEQVEALLSYIVTKVCAFNWWQWSNSLLIQTSYLDKERLLRELFPTCVPQPVIAQIKNNLPPSVGDFLGRNEDIQQILKVLDSPRWPVISIEGMSGVGKTTLAIKVADRCLRNSASGLTHPFAAVVWVSAKDQPDKKRWLNDILNIVARVLGHDAIDQKLLKQKRMEVDQLLRTHRTLLLIDNFETIEDRELECWMEEMPEPSKVLITSRYAKLRAVKAIHVQGLKQSDAIELIRYRERELELDSIISSDELSLLPLAQVTEGNPKAISMALSHLSDSGLSLNEVIEHLYLASQSVGDIFQYLFVRAWQTLTEDAQHILQVLPFFIDTVSKEALGAAAELRGYHLASALEQLERMSLLDQRTDEIGNVRYSIHPLTRSFACIKLAEVPLWEQQARCRWGRYYLRFAESRIVREHAKGRYWDALGGQGRLSAIDPEWENFKHVLAWAEHTQDDTLLVELILLLIHFLNRRGYYTERLKYASRAADAANRLGQFVDEAILRIDGIGHIHIEKGELDEAEQEIQAGLQIAKGLEPTGQDAKDLQALAYAFLARIDLQRVDKAKTQKDSNAVTKWLARANDAIEQGIQMECRSVMRLRVLIAGGELAQRQGKLLQKEQAYKVAIERYQAAIDLTVQDIGSDQAERNQLYHRQGFVYLDRYFARKHSEDLQQAEVLFKKVIPESAQMTAQIGEIGEIACAQFGLAQIALTQGEIQKAHELAECAYMHLSRSRAGHRLLEELTRFLADLEYQQLLARGQAPGIIHQNRLRIDR